MTPAVLSHHVRLDIGTSETPIGFNQFPDGQIQPYLIGGLPKKTDYTLLRVSLTTGDLLSITFQLCSMIKIDRLDVLYQYGGRSDKDTYGELPCPNTANIFLKEIAELQDFDDGILVLDPHSDILSVPTSKHIVRKRNPLWDSVLLNFVEGGSSPILIFPDGSAKGRFQLAAEVCQNKQQLLDLAGEALVAEKVRDQNTAAITHWELNGDVPPNTRVIVCDDICDGGATFRQLAQHLDKIKVPYMDRSLFVTHGLFTNMTRLTNIKQHFAQVFTTNSVYQYLNLGQVTDVW